MSIEGQWRTARFDPRKILLDPLNPRIEVSPGATQDEIRLKLLEMEDVIDLARGIERNNGLFYGERIICTEVNGKAVVLEGNRRITACQLLLKPSLIPTKYKNRFPALSAATKARIASIEADVAPSRAAAEPILTKRHTEQGAKPWSPVAKMRRAVRLLDSNSVDEVASLLGTSATQVKKLIRPYKLLKVALDMTCWTDEERSKLENEKLVTNPYTRLFTLADTKQALLLHFDDDQNPVSGLAQKRFAKEMERIARDFLLPDPTNNGKPRYDTRADTKAYFAELLAENEGKTIPAGPPSAKKAAGTPAAKKAGTDSATGQPTPPQAQPKTPKASTFFENLRCNVVNDDLIKLSEEIKNINPATRPIAASLLLRALFERSLRYKIRKEKKWPALMAFLQAKNPNAKAGRDPGLSELIAFSERLANGVFSEEKICRVLASNVTKSTKSYLDEITHLEFRSVDAPHVISCGNSIRQIIQYILDDN